MNNIIACHRPWCNELAQKLEVQTGQRFHLIKHEEELTAEFLGYFKPRYIFFPHWSYIIPDEIHTQFECIIFHMTDLPFGRGGSPLQNLIVRGFTETVISAIRCVAEIDAGPIYLKRPLNLFGNAEEIFIRANRTIEEMIIRILDKNITPKPQKGKVVQFKRRKPEKGNLSKAKSLDEVFDYIRMLDAEGYPSAFIRKGKFKLEFSRASRKVNSIEADVRITLENFNE